MRFTMDVTNYDKRSAMSRVLDDLSLESMVYAKMPKGSKSKHEAWNKKEKVRTRAFKLAMDKG